MFIVTYRNIFFAITGILVLASIVSMFVFGMSLGADFTGGVLLEVRYEGDRPNVQAIDKLLNERGVIGYSLRETGEDGYALRSGNLMEEQRIALPAIMSLNGAHAAEIIKLTEVGPTIGTELRNKAVVALALVLVCIMLFIAFAFRKVSTPVSSWVYGFIALLALIHDVIVPMGFFAVLGHFWGAQVDTLFVTAILTVLGFSVHDTIVVFDRVRENLRLNREQGRREVFAETAGKSLGQTFVRSINTSVTVAFTLLILFLFGPESTRVFSLTLLVGVVAGTYSSIFLATPLLVAWERYRSEK